MFREKPSLPVWHMGKIKVCESSVHGMGVFATSPIKKYELIERSPVIMFEKDLLSDWLETTESRHILHDHAFRWPGGKHCICLGYGSVYNHANNNNAQFKFSKHKKHPVIEFVAVRDIEAGEEIFTHYIRGGRNAAFTDGGTLVADGQLTGIEMDFLKSF